MGIKVLICGGRDYRNEERLNRVLDNIHGESKKIDNVVTGGANGADFFGMRWGIKNQIRTIVVPAEWDKIGRSAGPIRNQRMLDEESPDLVLAFPGGIGTSDMVKRAKSNNIELIEIEE